MLYALSLPVLAIVAGAMLVFVAFFTSPAPNIRSALWLRVAPVVVAAALIGLAAAHIGVALAGGL